LAHHASRGEAWDRAARYLYQAGEKALAQARPWATASFFQSTVDALDHIGDGADLTLKLDAFLELWVTKISTSQLEELQTVGEKAEALVRTLDDGPRLAKVQVRQAQAIALMGLQPGTFESAIEARVRRTATRTAATSGRGATRSSSLRFAVGTLADYRMPSPSRGGAQCCSHRWARVERRPG
jgi:hypothetical protein